MAAEVALQLEATGEPPVWIALNSAELGQWAGAVARMWTRWGTARARRSRFSNTVRVHSCCSRPAVTWRTCAAARRSALGLTAICNDGVATMAARMVSIVETVRPSMLVLRRELVTPFAAALEVVGHQSRRPGAMGCAWRGRRRHPRAMRPIASQRPSACLSTGFCAATPHSCSPANAPAAALSILIVSIEPKLSHRVKSRSRLASRVCAPRSATTSGPLNYWNRDAPSTPGRSG